MATYQVDLPDGKSYEVDMQDSPQSSVSNFTSRKPPSIMENPYIKMAFPVLGAMGASAIMPEASPWFLSALATGSGAGGAELARQAIAKEPTDLGSAGLTALGYGTFGPAEKLIANPIVKALGIASRPIVGGAVKAGIAGGVSGATTGGLEPATDISSRLQNILEGGRIGSEGGALLGGGLSAGERFVGSIRGGNVKVAHEARQTMNEKLVSELRQKTPEFIKSERDNAWAPMQTVLENSNIPVTDSNLTSAAKTVASSNQWEPDRLENVLNAWKKLREDLTPIREHVEGTIPLQTEALTTNPAKYVPLESLPENLRVEAAKQLGVPYSAESSYSPKDLMDLSSKLGQKISGVKFEGKQGFTPTDLLNQDLRSVLSEAVDQAAPTELKGLVNQAKSQYRTYIQSLADPVRSHIHPGSQGETGSTINYLEKVAKDYNKGEANQFDINLIRKIENGTGIDILNPIIEAQTAVDKAQSHQNIARYIARLTGRAAFYGLAWREIMNALRNKERK